MNAVGADAGNAALRARVAALAAEPGYGELLAALRERIEATGSPTSVTLSGLGEHARRALADLLGRRRVPGARVRVQVGDVDRALLASGVQAGLLEVLRVLGGRVLDRRASKASERAAWAALWAELEAHPVVVARAALGTWILGLRADGLLVRSAEDVASARRLMEQALAVLTELPAGGPSLAVLAADATGDPHALDAGTSLATLVLRAAVKLTDAVALPTLPAGRRELWAQVGVVCDPLSTHALVLNLLGEGAGHLSTVLSAHAAAGEPVHLTLRALERHDLLPFADVVFVCENPAVVLAAADQLGLTSAPLVCTEGMPGVAVGHLFTTLRAAGVTLRFHGDFDWGGLRIGNLLVSRYGALPWRMEASDYEAALVAAPKTSALRGSPVEALWDGALATAMEAAGRVVSEELVIESLLEDLA